MDELRKLYQAAGYSMRLWLLLVLNFAWGQTEIATARRSHFKIQKPELRKVSRFRNKRKAGASAVPGHWQAWPETWEAAISRMSKIPTDAEIDPKGLAFLTVQKQPLVRIVETKKATTKRYDAIGEAFD